MLNSNQSMGERYKIVTELSQDLDNGLTTVERLVVIVRWMRLEYLRIKAESSILGANQHIRKINELIDVANFNQEIKNL